MGRRRLKFGSLVLILAASPLLMGQAAKTSAESVWQKIDEGFEVMSMQLESQAYGTSSKLKILRINPDRFPIRVIDSRAFGVDRMEIKALARRAQALAAINGGFFLPDYRPLGILIVDGRQANPLRKGLDGPGRILSRRDSSSIALPPEPSW